MPRIDAFLKLGSAQGCSDVHLAVGVPPMLRMNGDLVPIRFRELGRAGARGLRHRDPVAQPVGEVPRRPRRRLLLRVRGRRPLPRQRVPQGLRRRRRVPDDPGRGADARLARAAADRQEALRLPPGHDPGDGLDRHRQVDDARRDDRHAEHEQEAQHHQPRGPDRVRPPQQAEPGRAARARHAPAHLRRGRARRDARGPGRDPGRRAARPRDDLDGDDRRRDRPPRARHAAHDERGQDHRPHDRRAAGRRARADQELPRPGPDRGHHAGAGQAARRAAAAARSARSW